jgi:hypothetical protein
MGPGSQAKIIWAEEVGQKNWDKESRAINNLGRGSRAKIVWAEEVGKEKGPILN